MHVEGVLATKGAITTVAVVHNVESKGMYTESGPAITNMRSYDTEWQEYIYRTRYIGMA